MSSHPSADSPRRALLCGYYGEHNLGDDALLQVLLAQLPDGWRAVVTAWDQPQVRRSCAAWPELDTVNRRHLRSVLAALWRCDALVLGGGSLLQDTTSFASLLYYAALILAARARGLPVLLWGQGLGPLHRRRSRLLARLLLCVATGISWRDRDSQRWAARWGVQALQGSDPVWGLPERPWRGAGGPILLCWRPVARLADEDWRALLTVLDQLAERSDRTVLWLPFHQDQDAELLPQLQQRGLLPEGLQHRSHRVSAADPDAAMALCQGASLVLAMRLHGLILAALAGSPCAALSYDPKVASAAAALDCPCQPLGAPLAPTLLESWGSLLDHPPDPQARRQLQQQSQVHRALLARLGSVPAPPARGRGR